jgi:hypothetical protein
LQDPVFKIPTQNRAGGVARVIECLPSKCETLSSNRSTTKIIIIIISKLKADKAI